MFFLRAGLVHGEFLAGDVVSARSEGQDSFTFANRWDRRIPNGGDGGYLVRPGQKSYARTGKARGASKWLVHGIIRRWT